jgi:hypothetical protein
MRSDCGIHQRVVRQFRDSICTAEALYQDRLPRVEAGSNTSTVTLRVVGGDEVSNMRQ